MKDSMMGSDSSYTRKQTIFINLKAKEFKEKYEAGQ